MNIYGDVIRNVPFEIFSLHKVDSQAAHEMAEGQSDCPVILCETLGRGIEEIACLVSGRGLSVPFIILVRLHAEIQLVN